MSRTKAQRQAMAERLPWVKRLQFPWPCDGIRWSSVAGRDLWNWGPGRKNPPRGIQPKSRCKKTARWSYRHMPTQPGFQGRRTSKFCWDHLVAQGIYGSMADEQRADRWFDKHPEPSE